MCRRQHLIGRCAFAPATNLLYRIKLAAEFIPEPHLILGKESHRTIEQGTLHRSSAVPLWYGLVPMPRLAVCPTSESELTYGQSPAHDLSLTLQFTEAHPIPSHKPAPALIQAPPYKKF